jgi:hypothetical protein
MEGRPSIRRTHHAADEPVPVIEERRLTAQLQEVSDQPEDVEPCARVPPRPTIARRSGGLEPAPDLFTWDGNPPNVDIQDPARWWGRRKRKRIEHLLLLDGVSASSI